MSPRARGVAITIAILLALWAPLALIAWLAGPGPTELPEAVADAGPPAPTDAGAPELDAGPADAGSSLTEQALLELDAIAPPSDLALVPLEAPPELGWPTTGACRSTLALRQRATADGTEIARWGELDIDARATRWTLRPAALEQRLHASGGHARLAPLRLAESAHATVSSSAVVIDMDEASAPLRSFALDVPLVLLFPALPEASLDATATWGETLSADPDAHATVSTTVRTARWIEANGEPAVELEGHSDRVDGAELALAARWVVLPARGLLYARIAIVGGDEVDERAIVEAYRVASSCGGPTLAAPAVAEDDADRATLAYRAFVDAVIAGRRSAIEALLDRELLRAQPDAAQRVLELVAREGAAVLGSMTPAAPLAPQADALRIALVGREGVERVEVTLAADERARLRVRALVVSPAQGGAATFVLGSP